MKPDALADLADRWRERAVDLRRFGAEGQAIALDACAEDLEIRLRGWALEALPLEDATEGGYSYSHLQHLVATGMIENVGEKGSPRIRRCDVPRKPGHGMHRSHSIPDIIDRSLAIHRSSNDS